MYHLTHAKERTLSHACPQCCFSCTTTLTPGVCVHVWISVSLSVCRLTTLNGLPNRKSSGGNGKKLFTPRVGRCVERHAMCVACGDGWYLSVELHAVVQLPTSKSVRREGASILLTTAKQIDLH